jgi:phosphatidate cytidylyltransferase
MGDNVAPYVSFTCAIIFLITLLPLSFLIAKELDNCFLKTQNKKNIFVIAILLYLIQFVPTLVYLPFAYTKLHWSTSPQNLTYIFMAVSFLVPFIGYFVLLSIVAKLPNKNKFNVFWFPLLTVFVGWTLEWLIYIALIRYWTTLFLLVISVVGVDVFGYIFGSWLGKHQLTKISPKKSWEGAIFGVCLTTLFVLLFLYLFGFAPNKIYDVQAQQWGDSAQGSFVGIQIGKKTIINTSVWWISCTLIVITICIVSVCGDLLFSWFKRKNNIKDFSNFLREHGGVLDRIDSLILVISFFGIVSSIVSLIFGIIEHTNLIFPTFNHS